MRKYVGNWINDNITQITIRDPANPTITGRQELNAMARMSAPAVTGKLRYAPVHGGEIAPYTEFSVVRQNRRIG